MVKTAPTKEQHEILLKTMHKFNEACNDIATTAFEKRCANKIDLQKVVYYPIRERYGLSSQMTIRAIAKVIEAYKRDKSIKPTFRPDGAMVYDQRIISWKSADTVSILTLEGRIIVPVVFGHYQTANLDRVRGQVDLIYRDGVFYLCVIVDVPEADMIKPVGVLGVDLGIVNLATDSDGVTFSGEAIDRAQKRCDTIKAALQKCGTKSAKRHLKKIGRREARFRRDVNHCISKKIVAKAKDTASIISLEKLKGIRKRITVRRAQRRRQHSWGFYQLKEFIIYKAAVAGVPVVGIDPAYTSQECPICHHIARSNRPNRDSFVCGLCGFSGHADHIAAMNIAARVTVNLPIVAGFIAHRDPPQLQTPSVRVG